MRWLQKDHYDESEFADAAVGISVRNTAQPDFVTHSHAFDELVLVRSGSGMHTTDAGSYKIEAGDAFCIRRMRRHSYSRTANLEIVNVLFRDAYLEALAERLKHLPSYHVLFDVEPVLIRQVGARKAVNLSPDELFAALTLADSVARELSEQSAGHRIATELTLSLLLLTLCRHEPESVGPADPALYRLAQLKRYIEDNVAAPLVLADLATAAGVSQRTLNRYCNRYLGMSPIELLTRFRLERARSLLAATTDSVTEIAGSCGFGDSNYFSRVFRRRFGMTPSSTRGTRQRGPRRGA